MTLTCHRVSKDTWHATVIYKIKESSIKTSMQRAKVSAEIIQKHNENVVYHEWYCV